MKSHDATPKGLGDLFSSEVDMAEQQSNYSSSLVSPALGNIPIGAVLVGATSQTNLNYNERGDIDAELESEANDSDYYMENADEKENEVEVENDEYYDTNKDKHIINHTNHNNNIAIDGNVYKPMKNVVSVDTTRSTPILGVGQNNETSDNLNQRKIVDFDPYETNSNDLLPPAPQQPDNSSSLDPSPAPDVPVSISSLFANYGTHQHHHQHQHGTHKQQQQQQRNHVIEQELQTQQQMLAMGDDPVAPYPIQMPIDLLTGFGNNIPMYKLVNGKIVHLSFEDMEKLRAQQQQLFKQELEQRQQQHQQIQTQQYFNGLNNLNNLNYRYDNGERSTQGTRSATQSPFDSHSQQHWSHNGNSSGGDSISPRNTRPDSKGSDATSIPIYAPQVNVNGQTGSQPIGDSDDSGTGGANGHNGNVQAEIDAVPKTKQRRTSSSLPLERIMEETGQLSHPLSQASQSQRSHSSQVNSSKSNSSNNNNNNNKNSGSISYQLQHRQSGNTQLSDESGDIDSISGGPRGRENKVESFATSNSDISGISGMSNVSSIHDINPTVSNTVIAIQQHQMMQQPNKSNIDNIDNIDKSDNNNNTLDDSGSHGVGGDTNKRGGVNVNAGLQNTTSDENKSLVLLGSILLHFHSHFGFLSRFVGK